MEVYFGGTLPLADPTVTLENGEVKIDWPTEQEVIEVLLEEEK